MHSSPTRVDLGIAPQFGSELLRLTRRCRSIDKHIAAIIDLSVDEMHCLSALFFDHPSSVKRLSELITIGSTRASKILRNLENRGYVSRAFDTADHRKEQVILTEAGERTVGRIITLYEEFGKELLVNWRNELTADFSWLLKTLSETK